MKLKTSEFAVFFKKFKCIGFNRQKKNFNPSLKEKRELNEILIKFYPNYA